MSDSIKTVTLTDPFDAHVHFRHDTSMMMNVVPLTAKTFSGAVVMPNISPPIFTAAEAEAYWERIIGFLQMGTPQTNFRPYTTLFFSAGLNESRLEDAKKAGVISVKFYPKNLTTNSVHGCHPGDPEVGRVLAIMQDMEIPLCVHGEAEGYYHDREMLFNEYVYTWSKQFPRLKIIMEHVSDRRTLQLLEFDNVYATVTPQHLMTTGNDWFGPPFNSALYCMPCVKRPEDREALQEAVMYNPHFRHKIMLGTDSAPHDSEAKHCGCAGVFTAPIALQLITSLFMEKSNETVLQNFVSDNANRIYGLDLPKKGITLEKVDFTIPEKYGQVTPMWAGKSIPWRIKEVS